jgi:hypothetical protein
MHKDQPAPASGIPWFGNTILPASPLRPCTILSGSGRPHGGFLRLVRPQLWLQPMPFNWSNPFEERCQFGSLNNASLFDTGGRCGGASLGGQLAANSLPRSSRFSDASLSYSPCRFFETPQKEVSADPASLLVEVAGGTAEDVGGKASVDRAVPS